jgi:hypothetical protein
MEFDMKSMTIHNLGGALAGELKEEAAHEGVSLNRLVKKLLSERLGLSAERRSHRGEFMDLFGTWSGEDKKSFAKRAGDFERIDREDWR